ncbi:hypothetical protein BHM03_00008931 [Ensete ventricosum]|nr:hypothetical protein BHM03_00008931 [Ensete ventricosum]
MDLNTCRRKPKMPSGKNPSATGARGSSSEVEEICTKNATKRPVESSVPDQVVIGRAGKWVKIAVRKHKFRHSKGSSQRVFWEKESVAQAKEDSSLSYPRLRSMKDLCGTRVRLDDEGYYVL